ncbi:Spy/CpxP family protein refolding chaperone [Geomonas ferrireducens]|uniref:Spy/CpxP family protein refolding chaperone n=1 Tax=Geomonas ferrireducens TaxID=2570227 RepID=UPI0010A94D50|nr:Spy/CpxP family protein refolding chaperone [Geomonas ferrireducens]
MKTRTVSILLATVALIAFNVPMAFAQMKQMPMMPMNDHAPGYGQMMESDSMGDMMAACLEHAEKLGLTDDQTMKMKPLHREMQKKQARFIADLKIAEIELAEIMEVKDFDLEKADAAVKKIEGIRTSHHLEMLSAMKEMRAILTDQQFKEMMKMAPMKMKMKAGKPGVKHQKNRR